MKGEVFLLLASGDIWVSSPSDTANDSVLMMPITPSPAATPSPATPSMQFQSPDLDSPSDQAGKKWFTLWTKSTSFKLIMKLFLNRKKL